MNAFEEQTIGQIAANDYRNASVFNKYNIDFCCNGDITIEEACKGHRVSPNRLLAEMEKSRKNDAQKEAYNSWPINYLIDYIADSCHKKVRKKLPEIKFYAEKVTEMHGQDHEELFDIYQEFLILKNVIVIHMNSEEKQLFSFVKELAKNENKSGDDGEIRSVNMIEKMEDEHQEMKELIKMIRKISNNYALLGNASTIYQALFGSLAILERDLRKCLHLENNILFPKALNLSNYSAIMAR